MFKCILAGGRDFNNYSLLEQKCDLILKDKKDIEIVSGTAKGADEMGEIYAAYKRYKVKRFPANWDLYKKAAGFIRNKEMAEYSDALIAFWSGSRGTENMIELMKKMDKPYRIVYYEK